MFIKTFPDEIDLLGFFESEPIVNEADDLHFAYKSEDSNGMEMIFAFCATTGWIKALISFNGKEISKYLSENINEISLKRDSLGEYLYTEVITDELITNIEIRVRPYISIKSTSLVR
ncbi:MAG: hypothetical protein LBU96_16740 [Yokenella regensburgei]|jgi:phage FluMu protein gp41|uniref:Uncharacterized protein n=1 Tax=Yokenella regensburgei TaxID=158877 RepID=A0ABX9RW36_9ENTR|nr:hypothetical protein [Yokenella regensburgei]MDR3106075.1 hypothetical protein [Yokenella regensburgei]RKR54240.1 hypothetical protein C7387_2386 [Yokenella regensburgei]VFS38752.1 Uncharacterised protein [Yokenella regensburgei]